MRLFILYEVLLLLPFMVLHKARLQRCARLHRDLTDFRGSSDDVSHLLRSHEVALYRFKAIDDKCANSRRQSTSAGFLDEFGILLRSAALTARRRYFRTLIKCLSVPRLKLTIAGAISQYLRSSGTHRRVRLFLHRGTTTYVNVMMRALCRDDSARWRHRYRNAAICARPSTMPCASYRRSA